LRARLQPAMAEAIRPGVTSMILARPCTSSVMTPACDPVKERASMPRVAIAMASSAIEMRSPDVSSMSSSRPGGAGLTPLARSISSSVVSPIADTTTTTWLPTRFVATMRLATRLMPSASATEEPPYFCTTRAIWTRRSSRLFGGPPSSLAGPPAPRPIDFPPRQRPLIFRRMSPSPGNSYLRRRGVAVPRRPGRALPRPRTPGRRPPAARWPAGLPARPSA